MAQMQLQYRPVGMEFITADSLPALEGKVTEALNQNKLLHGDWKALATGQYVQAVCPAEWRPMPPPASESPILQPQPGRILG